MHSVGVARKKVDQQQAVEISLELAPYIMAYKNYKNVLNAQGGPQHSMKEAVYKATYEDLRLRLLNDLSPFAGGNLDDVFDLAMDTQRLTRLRSLSSNINDRINAHEALKNSAVYEALADSFGEILTNAVDETLEKFLKSSERMNPVDTLRATLLVDIDDHTNPDQLTISCFHKDGRGFKATFLDDVSTLEKRKDYIATFSSNKLSEAKLHGDIPLFIGGRGQGLRMLMRKIDEGTFSGPDRKYAKSFNKAAVSSIEFNNKVDSSGNIEGAMISITSSKKPVAIEERSSHQRIERDSREVMKDIKKRTRDGQSSPQSIAIDMDFLNEPVDETDNESTSPNPQNVKRSSIVKNSRAVH